MAAALRTSFSIHIVLVLSFTALNAQQTVLHQDSERDFQLLIKEYEQGLYGRSARSAEKFLNDYQNPEWVLMIEEAELYQLKSWLRMDHPGTIPKILSFAASHQPEAVAHRAVMIVAEDAYDKHQYDEAIKYFTLVDSRSLLPAERSSLYFKYGYSLFVNKEFEQAAVLFNETRDVRDKFYYPANYYYGMTQYFQGNYPEAIISFERVAPSEFYKDYIPYYITQIHFNNKEYTKVIGYGNQVMAMPTVQNKTEITHLVGQAYFETEDYAAALPHLEYVEQNTEKLRTDDFYQLGMSYYHAGRYEDAIPILLEIRNETGVKAHYANYYLGQAYLKTGDKASARNSLRNAMLMKDVATVATEATFHYGRLSAEAGDDMEAIRVLQTIPTSSPDYNESQKTLAAILTNTSDYGLAIRELEAMNTLTKTLQEAYQKVTLYRAEQLIQENNPEEAMTMLDKALKYPVNKSIQAMSIFWKGELSHLESDYNESIKWFNQYFTLADGVGDLPIQQNPSIGHYTQGYNYLRLLDYNEALHQFEMAIHGIALIAGSGSDITFVKNQILPDALLRAGDSAFKRNQLDKALQFYDRSIQNKFSGQDYARYQKALIKGLQKKPQERIIILEELVKDMPSSLWADDALYMAGNTYQDQNQKAKAIASYERIVSQYKQSSPLLHPAILKLGLLSYNSGQFNDALKYYKSVYQYNPDPETSKEAMSAIQEIYVNELDKPDAFFEFAGTIPGYSVSGSERDSILYAAAENHYAQGNYDKAAESFKIYLDQNPKGAYSLKAKFLRSESLSLVTRWPDALSAYEAVIKEGQSSYLASSLYKAALIAYNQQQDMVRAYRYYSDYIPLAESDEKQFEAMLGALRSAYKLKNPVDVFAMTAKINEHARATDDIRAIGHYYSGMLASEAGNYDKAIASFNAVIRINSAELAAESRYHIASIYERKGESDLAAKLAEEAARANVGYPEWVARSLMLLSDIQFKKGDLLNSRAIIEAIIENFQGDEAIINEATQRRNRIMKEEENQSRIKQVTTDTLELQSNPKRD